MCYGSQSDKEKEVVRGVNACGQLFCDLLERGDLFVGKLPKEEELLEGECRGFAISCAGQAPISEMLIECLDKVVIENQHYVG